MTFAEFFGIVFGPGGAVALLLVFGIVLARDHLRRDTKTEEQLERAEALADTAVAGWCEQTAASAKSAEGTEKSALAIEAIREQLRANAEERARDRRTRAKA